MTPTAASLAEPFALVNDSLLLAWSVPSPDGLAHALIVAIAAAAVLVPWIILAEHEPAMRGG